MTICTDSRSEKIAQFAEQPCSHVCWYFPISREQFRIDCKAEVVDFDSKSADLAKVCFNSGASVHNRCLAVVVFASALAEVLVSSGTGGDVGKTVTQCPCTVHMAASRTAAG